MCADEFLLPWLRWRCSPAELTGGRGRAVVFSLMDRAGYREANDAVLAAAGGLKRSARPVLPRRSAHRSGPGA